MFKKLIKSFCNSSGIPIYLLRQNYQELTMLLVRIYGRISSQSKKIQELQKKGDLNLIFGCGETRHSNWIGIDCFIGKSVDLLLDLRRPLPFADASIDYCYSEHFLEHLYPDEAIVHLKEVFRILKPSGIYRLVVPAGIHFVEKYISGDEDFFRKAFPWEERPFDAVYCILHWEDRHRSFFDFNQLKYLSHLSGFMEVRESACNGSKIKILNIDIDNSQRKTESLYVELLKISDKQQHA